MTDHARAFHDLHKGPGLLVLPNAWDAASAVVMEAAGAKAVATSSAAVAWAHGYPDGDALPVAALVAAIAEIARRLKVPLTADIEGGYTDDLGELAETVRRMVGAGAVGINLEDGRRDPALHARKIAAARKAAEGEGVDLFINARTDVYLAGLAEGEAAVGETLRRGGLFADAGASGLFVPFVKDPDHIGRIVAGVTLPVNVIVMPGLPAAADLVALGVRRLSSGTSPFRHAYGAMEAATRAFLADGDGRVFNAAPSLNLNERFG